MKRVLLIAMLLSFAQSAAAAGPAQWTWEAGKQRNDGSITIKSVSGGSTYSGTQNPTGAVARTNQNAVTQPPTVIIQATGGGVTGIVSITRSAFNGGLGGRAGADAKCEAAFGAGWRFATLIDVAGGARPSVLLSGYPNPWVDYAMSSTTQNCNSWTSGDSSSEGSVLGTGGAPIYWTTEGGKGCNGPRPLTCVKLQ